MRNEARAPLAESPERKARSSRRQVPQLRVVPPPPKPGEEFDHLDWASLEETTKKLDKDRTERKAAEAEALAREQAEFKEHKERAEDARILREVDEEERKAVKTRLRDAMDQMRTKERAKMDASAKNRELVRHNGTAETEAQQISEEGQSLSKRLQARSEREAIKQAQAKIAEEEREERLENSVEKHTLPKDTNPEFAHQEQRVIFNFNQQKNRERFEKVPVTVQEEVAELQKKLSFTNDEETVVQARINELKNKRGFFARLGRFLSKVTIGEAETPDEQTLRLLQEELKEIQADQHDLLEEIQSLTYRAGIKKTEGRTRKATMAPESLTEVETARSIGREEAKERFNDNRGMSEADAEAAYGLSEQKEEEDPTIEIKEEEVNLSDLAPEPEDDAPTIEIHEEEEIVKPKKEARKVKRSKMGSTELALPTEVQETTDFMRENARTAYKELGKGLTTEGAENILMKKGLSARQMWFDLEKLLREKNTEISGEHPATTYVIEVAKMLEAKRRKDTELTESSEQHLADLSKKYGIDPEFVQKALPVKKGGVRGANNALMRRNRAIGSERRFLRP